VLAPFELAEQYRAERGGLGRRPLRVYISAPYTLARDLGTILVRPTLNGHRTERAALDSGGMPTQAAKQRLDRWAETTEELREEGLRTV
jgi:hypothetical protein